jgi:hypothetical protein
MDDNNTHGTGTVDCFQLTMRTTNPR